MTLHYSLFVSLFLEMRVFIDDSVQQIQTVKLFQFHASRFEIDNFLDNGSKVSRSHGIVRRMRRVYTRSRVKL